jgi:hypothetical protein
VFALTYSVDNGVPFHFTVALEKKFVPVTLRGNAGPPAIAELGLMLAIVGGTVFMVNVAPSDVPRLVVTVTVAVPGVAIRLAGTVAVSWLVPTNAVASGVPFQFTVAPEKRYVPFTVSVNVAPPAAVELGLKLVIVGPSVSSKKACVAGQGQSGIEQPSVVVPFPTICPESLIELATTSATHAELAGRSAFRSVMTPPEYRKAWFTEPSAELKPPTICPLTLIPLAQMLYPGVLSPSVPKSVMMPPEYRKA